MDDRDSKLRKDDAGITPHGERLDALVRAAIAGDRAAQGRVLEHLLPRIQALARVMVRDPADTDDAVQDASIQILKSLRTYDGRASLRTWAGRVAQRHVLRYIERKRRRWWRTKPVEPEQLDVVDETEPLPKLGETLPRDLQHYLRELPEAQRQALVLRYALGHSLPEIAELMGVGVSTVRGRIRLGAAALRKAVRRDLKLGAIKERGAHEL